MSENAPKAPAGWYPDPTGKQRYWDGENWLDLEAPETPSRLDTDETQGQPRSRSSRRRLRFSTVIVAVVLVLAGAGIAFAIKLQNDQVGAEKAAAAQDVKDAEAAEQARAEAEEERQAAADQIERDGREVAVDGIEGSVKVMAQGHVEEGIIDGPVIEVSCDPLDGGSTDDLAQKTTVFQCFVANEDNGDGTMSGYYYNATMNWDSGQYTYGFGQP